MRNELHSQCERVYRVNRTLEGIHNSTRDGGSNAENVAPDQRGTVRKLRECLGKRCDHIVTKDPSPSIQDTGRRAPISTNKRAQSDRIKGAKVQDTKASIGSLER